MSARIFLIESDREKAGFLDLPAEIAGTAGKVDDCASAGYTEPFHRRLAPSDIKPERHDAVDEVVARRDRVEHRPYLTPLLLPSWQMVGVDGYAICENR